MSSISSHITCQHEQNDGATKRNISLCANRARYSFAHGSLFHRAFIYIIIYTSEFSEVCACIYIRICVRVYLSVCVCWRGVWVLFVHVCWMGVVGDALQRRRKWQKYEKCSTIKEKKTGQQEFFQFALECTCTCILICCRSEQLIFYWPRYRALFLATFHISHDFDINSSGSKLAALNIFPWINSLAACVYVSAYIWISRVVPVYYVTLYTSAHIDDDDEEEGDRGTERWDGAPEWEIFMVCTSYKFRSFHTFSFLSLT